MFFKNKVETDESHWVPLADLMTGLMMIFMFIAVLYMSRINQVASDYQYIKNNLGRALCNEFAKNLSEWHAECDPQALVIRFNSPDVLFDTGKSVLKPKFVTILNDFFPRYNHIIYSKQFKDSIEEIRIEGHTSSKWGQGIPIENAYFANMQLSQARTQTVLQHVLTLQKIQNKDWLKKHVTANGLSSSHPILNKDGSENAIASQRVEIRIKTNADNRLDEMFKVAKE